MADNVAVTAGTGTAVATDDVSGVHYQRVKITDGTPDGATHLMVVAEDAAHTTGDTGLVLMAVRADTAAALGGTDGDYMPLIVNASGQLHIAPVVLGAGTAAIGKLGANSGVDIGDVDVKSIAAGENLIGLVGASDIVVTITPTLAAEAHTAGDLLFDSTEVASAVRANGGTAIVQSITIIDAGDQKPALKLLFANAQTDFGAPGGVPDPDDNEAKTVIGVVSVAAADYVDLGANSVVTVSNIGLLLKAGAATTSVWLAGIATGTPTPASTSDLQIVIGLLRS